MSIDDPATYQQIPIGLAGYNTSTYQPVENVTAKFDLGGFPFIELAPTNGGHTLVTFHHFHHKFLTNHKVLDLDGDIQVTDKGTTNGQLENFRSEIIGKMYEDISFTRLDESVPFGMDKLDSSSD
jgi:hypothetical protein